MKSKHMVWSLVLLSPYCLEAAASSSAAAPGNSHWEAVHIGSILTRTKSDLTLQPTKLALEEAEHAVKFVTPLARLNKDIYLKELKATTPKKPHHRIRRQAPVMAEESSCYQNISAEKRALVFAELTASEKTLQSTAMVFSSNGEAVSINDQRPYHSSDKGTVLRLQDYNWTQKIVAEGEKTKTVWKPKLALTPEDDNRPLCTLTAMNNLLNASVLNGSVNGIDIATARNAVNLGQELKQNVSNAIPTSQQALMKQIAELTKQSDALFASLKLDPAQAYRIQAVVDYFKQGSTEEQIFHEAFGTALETMNNRPAVVRMLAEVERHVQDPNIGAWIANTYEPKEVKNLRLSMAAYKKEENIDTKKTLGEKCNALASTIHADAIKGLNALVKQEKIITDKLRDETKPFEAQVGELRNVLRQLHELQTIHAAFNVDVPAAASTSAASSSASSSSASV